MPAPSQVSAANVNFELGVSNTLPLLMSNNWVKNVACVPADTLISTSNLTSGSGTVTAPANATYAIIKVWGSGGAGVSSSNRAGGGGGGFTSKNLRIAGGTSFSYNVGVRGTASGGSGRASNVTVLGTIYNATGGTGGSAGVGGTGGSGANGDINLSGGNGGVSIFAPVAGGDAGGIGYGGGAGVVGGAGNEPGAGGGTDFINAGYNGANGRVIIEFYRDSQISYGNLRWGINVLGGISFQNEFGASYSKTYSTDNTLTLESYQVVPYDPPFTTGTTATVSVTFSNLGTLSIPGSTTTWLTSGANTEYTIRFDNFGPDVLTSGTSNTDLNLGTSRTFTLSASQSGVGADVKSLFGQFVLKDNAAILITRPVYMVVTAELV